MAHNSFDTTDSGRMVADFFTDLEESLKAIPNYRKAYSIMNRVFQQCLNEKVGGMRMNFAGTFAKLDYLLKEMQAPRNLIRTINDTRAHFRKRAETEEAELQANCLHDLKNVCRFVSFVHGVDIPESLSSAFPIDRAREVRGTLVGESLRVIVERWDATFVYVQAEEGQTGTEVKVCYAHSNFNYDFDWSYLKSFFYAGAQLNLIRPRMEKEIVYPELIIFEPDYLINISTVARCFTNYADSPFVDLIKKIEPARTSQAMELGNFAGQLLDEEIQQLPASHTYGQSVREFFRHHAIRLLSAGIDSSFHDDARKQRQHIAQALETDLPARVSRFSTREGMVEPSFYSEMLGLQGRMDYLQLDYKVLLEQKSGKGAFPYNNFVKPQQTEEHYVQLLLYMLLIRYNYRSIYERNNRELHAFLLYSKYSESLLGLGFSTEMIFKAIQVRNGLAYAERIYTQEDGFRMLENLRAESFNLKHTGDSLWTRYQSKQIEEVLSPLRKASELEKAYYFRFLTFIANEIMMSKLGSQTKENSGFASIWHDSLEEKRQAGNIYDRLTLISPDQETRGSIQEVVLRMAETEENEISNFRVGDVVILYAYEHGREPDARKTMVFKCTIDAIEADRIVLKLRAAQSDSRVFLHEQGKLWAVEPDNMDAAGSSLYKGMHSFLSAPQSRRDLLLMQREPEVDPDVRLCLDHGIFNTLALRVKAAKDFFLIIGPPGTGKTSFGLMTTLREELSDPEVSVLLLSYTNRAVDEICSKLHREGIDFIRIGVEQNCSAEYREKLLSVRAQECQNIDQLKELIHSARIFVGTTAAFNSNISLFQQKQFSLAIIDEASQILEPHLIGLLSVEAGGQPAIRKFVMIGDHKQLPAVVQQRAEVSQVKDERLKDIGLTDCRNSLFERLLMRYRNDECVTYMLRQQGRMHREIALFPNQAFYDNELTEVSGRNQQVCPLPAVSQSKHGVDQLLQTRRVVFLDVEPSRHIVSDKVNQEEADIIAATILRIYELEKAHFDSQRTVGVIVPYRNQIAAIRKTLDKTGISSLHEITIDTVERYQGSQRKYIIYGFTIQRYYQMRFLSDSTFVDERGNMIDRKLNVAMTRAEEHLILVGNANLLANNPVFSALLRFVRERQGFFRLRKEDYMEGRFEVTPCHPSTKG